MLPIAGLHIQSARCKEGLSVHRQAIPKALHIHRVLQGRSLVFYVHLITMS